MPIPQITLITVTGTYLKSDGSPCKGVVKFTPSLDVATPGALLPTVAVAERLDAFGAFTVSLAATDDPDWSAPGWHYIVDEIITGRNTRTYNIIAPVNGGPIDLSTVAPVINPDTVTPYILATEKAAPLGVATLDSGGQVPADQLGNAPGGGGGGTPSGTVVSETSYGQAATAGAAAAYSRGDHSHGTPSLGTTGTTAAAGNHTHSGVYQPLASDLTTIAGLTATTDNVIQSVSSTWASRTPEQLKTTLSLVKGDVGLGNVDNTSDASKPISTATASALNGKQPLDSDLTDIAALTPTNNDVMQRKSGAWTNSTTAQLKTDLAITESDVLNLTTDLAAKAPLASPTLTGTPLAPTASQGTNTTQIATTAYVQTEAGLLIPKSLVDAKGDLLVGSAADAVARLAVGSDGQVLTADSASTNGVKWAAAGGSGTDYKTGSNPVTGKWYRAPSFGPVGSNLTMTLNRLYFSIFRLAATKTFDRIGFDLVTVSGASGVCRLGIFQSDASGDLPGTLVLDAGTVAVDTGGPSKTITINQQLTAGVYWLGIVNQTTGSAVIRASTSYDPLIPYFSGASMFTGSTAPGGIFANSVSGALASNPTIADNDNGPIIGLRMS